MTSKSTGIKNFEYVQMSLNLVFTSLTELGYLSKARGFELLNGPPFQYYTVTLQYMFIMEYIKLLESDSKRNPLNHFASVEKLSIEVYKDIGTPFKETHDLNLSRIEALRQTDYFKNLKNKRDKKFGHTDADFIGNPMSIEGLADDTIEKGLEQLNAIKQINDACTSPYGYKFFFQHPDNRTDNFIKFHTNYKNYYFDNYTDAVSKGYH